MILTVLLFLNSFYMYLHYSMGNVDILHILEQMNVHTKTNFLNFLPGERIKRELHYASLIDILTIYD